MLVSLIARLRGLVTRRNVERELDEELAFHLEQETAANVARGMAPDEARRVALGTLGGLTQTVEGVRDVRATWVDSVWRDVRFAVRGLRRDPAYASVTLLTLAVAIGANAAIFGIADAALFKPLPFEHADRLVAVRETAEEHGLIPVNAMHAREWRRLSQTLESIALIGTAPLNLTGVGDPERLPAARVSPELFPMLGIRPQLGRTFREDENVHGQDGVVLISDGLWRRRFGADPDIIGRTVTLNGTARNVVGVLPADFEFPSLAHLYAIPVPADLAERPEVWIPLAPMEMEFRPDGAFNFICVALLKPGFTPEQAEAELDGLEAGIAPELTQTLKLATSVVPLRTQVVSGSAAGITLLFGAVGVVLLIAAVNVASLSIARLSARRQELAMKSALGASHARLTREVLTEGLVVAGLGGGLGVLLGVAGLRAMLALAPGDVPRLSEAQIDGRVLLFTLGVTMLTGLVIGVLGAWRFSSVGAREAAATGTRTTASGAHLRLRAGLVAAEVALCAVCLVACGLLLRSFGQLLDVNLGFETARVTTVDVALTDDRYADAGDRGVFVQRVLDRVGTVPGIEAAGATHFLPLDGIAGTSGLIVEGRPDVPTLDRPLARVRSASPGLFAAMGIDLRNGRGFSPSDADRAVAVISEAAANTIWAGEDAIGKRFRFGPAAGPVRWIEVVGVAGDVHSDAADLPAPLTVYVPYALEAFPTVSFVFRTQDEGTRMQAAVRDIVRSIDPDVPMSPFRRLQTIVDDAMAQRRFHVLVLATFAATAVALVVIGLYGVVSYAVSQRTREIAVRLAIGAAPGAVRRMVVWHALRPTLLGLAIGVPAALVVAVVMRSLLFEVMPYDLMTVSGVAGLLLAASVASAWLPARRACAVEPSRALRAE
jgi:putative ABC transport system permease protein